MPNLVLTRFMVFDASDGQQEGSEANKLLYHWTKDATNNLVEISEQIDDVCLCDASISASARLNQGASANIDNHSEASSDQPCNDIPRDSLDGDCNPLDGFGKKRQSLVLTFESTVIVAVEVEASLSIWMAAHVCHMKPNQELLTASQSEQQQQQPRTNDQSSDTSGISSAAIERLINNMYLRFCLLNGSFKIIISNLRQSEGGETDSDRLKDKGREKLRQICASYFSNVLSEIHLSSTINNIPALYNFVVYLDLNPITLMKVNSFINHLVCIDAIQIRHTMALFNEQLLWSSMNMQDTRSLYNYLVAVLVRDALQEELSKEMDKVRRIKENMPIYLNDQSDNADNNLESSMATLDLCASDEKRELSKFHLTVFRSSNNMTLAFVLKDNNQRALLDKCEQMLTSDSRLGVIPMASLAQSVGQNFLKANSLAIRQASRASSSKKRASSASRSREQFLSERKYLEFDRLSLSASWSANMEFGSQRKDVIIKDSSSVDSSSNQELTRPNRKLRLTKYLLELEPEQNDLRQMLCGKNKQVAELLAKTTNDTWLTVMNSKYRSVYSIYKMKNVGLSEAHQYATDLVEAILSVRH